jgi:PilZ domain-containing protein
LSGGDKIDAIAWPGRSMEQDRRRTPRYPFEASIEMREGSSQDKRTASVSGLSLNGCYVSTESPYPEGTSVTVKVFTATEFYEGQATVIYTQEKLGMGLMFTETKPYYLMVLRKWLLSAMMAKKEASR